MEKLQKATKKLFTTALCLSIGFPFGVVGIVFGAINGWWILLAFGVLLAIGGFYVSPVMWVMFAENKSQQRLLSLIVEENIYKVSDLAQQLSQNPKFVALRVNKLIQKGFLSGFLFKDKEKLVLNTNKKQTQSSTKPSTSKCPNCGAQMDFDEKFTVCPYCGFKQKN